MKTISKNRKIYFNYDIQQEFNAGISLTGTEIKSIRINPGLFTINEAFVKVYKNTAVLLHAYIGHYSKGNIHNHKETRERQLLLNKKEINKLRTAVSIKHLSIIPIQAYWKGNLVKVRIALCKGKNKASKKQYLIEQDVKRDMAKEYKKYST